MAVKKNELIREYARAIREGNAAIFGGAGLSRPSGYVDWKSLLRPLAQDIDLDIEKESDLLSVAQYYRNTRATRASINQAIMDAFTKSVNINENVRVLTRLPIFTYWTTNYDTLIEDGIKEANRNPDIKSEPEQLSTTKRDRDAVVYKMHGDATNPAHAILTKYDYEMYEQKRPLFRTALKGDLISKTFLFIGFSFEDPNLDYILGQIHSLLGEDIHDHYCFFKRIQRDDYFSNEDYGYDKAKQELREEDLRRYGIQTCFVDSYDEITEILHNIESTVRMKNIFISGSAYEFGTAWNKEKAKSFARELAATLVSNDYKITSGFGLEIGSAVINGALDVIYDSKYRHINEHLCLRPFPQEYSSDVEKEKRNTQYRKDMIEDIGIAIFIFGNKLGVDSSGHKQVINASGCRKEYEIAVEKGRIVIPIGSTGYMAKELFDEVKSQCIKYPYLQKYFDRLENETDVKKLVELILDIINEQQII